MVTVTPVIIQGHRRKDGTFNVKIRITYKRRSRFLPTNIFALPGDLTRSGKLRPCATKSKADALAAELLRKVSDINYLALLDMDVDGVVRFIRGTAREDLRVDFIAFTKEVGKARRSDAYSIAANSLARWFGAERVDIGEITAATVRRWVADYGDKAARYCAILKTAWGEMMKRYNNEDEEQMLITRRPFHAAGIATPTSHGQRALSVAEMQAVIDAKGENALEQQALDLFVVSFALMGCNLSDLMEQRPPRGNTLVYHRKKTRSRRADSAEMRVRIPGCIAERISRLHRRADAGMWLKPRKGARDISSITNSVNSHLADVLRRLGIPVVTFYSARHTWATVARSKACGIDGMLIEDCLCHISSKLLNTYADKDFTVMDEANEKVLQIFRWDACGITDIY